MKRFSTDIERARFVVPYGLRTSKSAPVYRYISGDGPESNKTSLNRKLSLNRI